MKYRRKARQFTLTVLYQFEVGLKESIAETFKYSQKHLKINNEDTYNYLKSLLFGIEQKWDFLNDKIKEYSKGWALERILIIDRNILRIALYEMYFLDDVPIKVSINEAVELAKMYSGERARIFINGILDKIYKKEFYGKDDSFMHNSK